MVLYSLKARLLMSKKHLIQVQSVTVADGGTESGVIDLNGAALVGVGLPSTFDNTTLGFTVCDTTDGTYLPLVYNEGASMGSNVSLTVAASKYVPLNPNWFLGVKFCKLVTASQTGATIIKAMKRALD